MSAICNRKSATAWAAAVLFGLTGAATAAEPYLRTVPPPPSPYLRTVPPPQAPVTAPRNTRAVERNTFLTDDMRKLLPHLGNNFEILGPGTGNAFGDVLNLGVWVNPVAGTKENPFAGMDRLFGQYGYRRQAGFDLSLQPGVEKIVLYTTVTPEGDVKEITSAAHQEADGSWTMKPGKLPKIRIATPYLLRGPQYGLPIAVYAR